MTILNLLEASGFRIRGKRADCKFCTGRVRLTVAFDERKGVAYCHRCQWRTSTRRLANQQGVALPPQRIGLARLRKQRFETWLSKTSTDMSRREYSLLRRARFAAKAFRRHPDREPAWTALAEWYHAQRSFETFWASANDRLGRIALYKMWRANAEN